MPGSELVVYRILWWADETASVPRDPSQPWSETWHGIIPLTKLRRESPWSGQPCTSSGGSPMNGETGWKTACWGRRRTVQGEAAANAKVLRHDKGLARWEQGKSVWPCPGQRRAEVWEADVERGKIWCRGFSASDYLAPHCSQGDRFTISDSTVIWRPDGEVK